MPHRESTVFWDYADFTPGWIPPSIASLKVTCSITPNCSGIVHSVTPTIKIGGELTRIVNGCILLLAAISITFAAVSGAYHLDMQQLLALILRQENVPVQEQIVFWQIRVPRILAALLLGAALAGAGTTYQGMLRNPLVSPDILGVSAGAGLGACTAILWGLSIVYIQLYAFCGGLMVVAGVWLITRRVTRHDPILTLVLVGIALGTLCGAGISLIKTLADPYTQLPSITFWLLGDCPP